MGNAIEVDRFADLLGAKEDEAPDTNENPEDDENQNLEKSFNYSASVAELMRPRPLHLRHALLRQLIDDRYFLDLGRGKSGTTLHTVAQIMSVGLNRPKFHDVLKIVFPHLDLSKLKSWEATVVFHIYRALRDTERGRFLTRLQKAWVSLTNRQKNFVLKFYCDEEGRSMSEVAKSMGIKVTSLKDRKAAVYKKMKAAFPELAPLTDEEPDYTKFELKQPGPPASRSLQALLGS